MMRLLIVTALICSLFGGTANAQSSKSNKRSPFERIVRVSNSVSTDAAKPGRVFLAGGASDAEEEAPADGSSAAPPPDPESPDWGHYLDPAVTPMVPQAREYSLIGPPRGIIQDSSQQEYRVVIADPNALLPLDSSFDQNVNIFRPDGIAPIGVFGDHTLPTGTMFISYRYLQSTYDQIFDGSHKSSVPAAFPFAPSKMVQNSQVAQLEYGVTQDFTVMAFLPFQHNKLTSDSATGDYAATFTNPGDIRVTGMYVVRRGDRSQSHVNLGLSIPVGFLEQQTVFGTTPGPSPTLPNLPYQIRTSSGTYDLTLGYTYRKQTDFWTFGGQANAVIPMGKNTLDYELGTQFQTTAWVSRRWTDSWSTSARLDGRFMDNIRGADPRLDTTLSPANQTQTQGYRYLNGLIGANYLLNRPGHRIGEQRLFIEAGLPLYQWVDGPQLGLSWILNAGWGMAF